MTGRKIYSEKTFATNGLRKVMVLYARFGGRFASDNWIEKYTLLEDGQIVDTLSPSAVTPKILKDFLNGIV